MTLIDFLILAIVAAICGSLGQAIVGFSRGGCLVAMALGFIGADWKTRRSTRSRGLIGI